MAVDIAIYELGTPMQGNHPPAPVLPAYAGQLALAEDTPSGVLAVAVPSVIELTATAPLKVDMQAQADAASLDPSSSFTLLQADVPRYFSVRPGHWVIETTAA